MKLSILCITKAQPFAIPFLQQMRELADRLDAQFVVALDHHGDDGHPRSAAAAHKVAHVTSRGYLETVLDEAIEHCDGDYILRLDDDERCSYAMQVWLFQQSYLTSPHWKFARAHLWRDPMTMILDPQLWPDHQTRLSVKRMSGGRGVIHAGSPFGGGMEAPCILLHHKFLVKSLKERLEIIKRYDSIQRGCGTHFAAFSAPETVRKTLTLAHVGTGVLHETATTHIEEITL